MLFRSTTGASAAQMAKWQSKAQMKALYAKGGVPTARQTRLTSARAARSFAQKVGYPLFTKPEKGVGSMGARKIADEAALEDLLAHMPDTPYVLEEFVTGEIVSYEAIVDAQGNTLFENHSEYPIDIAASVEQQLDVWYYTRPDVDPKLSD